MAVKIVLISQPVNYISYSIKHPSGDPSPRGGWEERNCSAEQGLFKVDPLAGSRFEWERLNPTGFPGNGSLDEVIRRHIQ